MLYLYPAIPLPTSVPPLACTVILFMFSVFVMLVGAVGAVLSIFVMVTLFTAVSSSINALYNLTYTVVLFSATVILVPFVHSPLPTLYWISYPVGMFS